VKVLPSWSDELAAAEQALRPRAALLALAFELDEVGIWSRLADGGRSMDGLPPAVLRCWKPGGKTSILVACTRDSAGGLRLQYHLSGKDLGDAAALLQCASPVGKEIALTVAATIAAEEMTIQQPAAVMTTGQRAAQREAEPGAILASQRRTSRR
jgi:hypothetical protein